MRKWMRERLKRRKKPTEDAPEVTKQAPLQPAYFGSDLSGPSPAQELPPEPSGPGTIEQTRPEDSAPGPVEDGMAAVASSREDDGAAPKRKGRRRGRGGRGRAKKEANGATSPSQDVAGVDAPPPTVEPPEEMPQPATPTTQTPKGVVVLSIGLPGSGKSSWFKRNNITPLSSDLVRTLLFDDATEQRFQDLVFSNLRSMLKARLIARRPTNYVDATNLTPHERHSWIKLAKDFGYEPQAVFFDVPLEVCLQRNQKRSRTVGEDVMRRFAAKLKPPTFEEGFTKITVVRVKSKE